MIPANLKSGDSSYIILNKKKTTLLEQTAWSIQFQISLHKTESFKEVVAESKQVKHVDVPISV